MNIFEIVVWLFFILNVFLILKTMKVKHHFIKPSFVFLLAYFIFVCVGGTLYFPYFLAKSDIFWEALFMISIFPTFCIVWINRTWNKSSERLLYKIAEQDRDEINKFLPSLILSTSLSLMTCIYYFTKVPVGNSGIYARFFKPEILDTARASSSTLLDSELLRWMLVLNEKVFAPLSVSIASFVLFRVRNIPKRLKLVILVCLFISCGSTMLYGARSPVLVLVLVAFFTLILQNGFKFNNLPRKVGVLLSLVIVFMGAVIPFLASADLSVRSLKCQTLNIVDRAFIRGAADNYLYIEYARKNGFQGVSTVPKLSAVFGTTSVQINRNVAELPGFKSIDLSSGPLKNLTKDCRFKPQNATLNDTDIDETRENTDIDETRENTQIVQPSMKNSDSYLWSSASFVSNLFLSAGFFGIAISILLVMSLDFMFFVYRNVSSFVFSVMSAAMVVPLTTLTYSQFNTALISGGIIPIIILSLLFERMQKGSIFKKVRSIYEK